jgi:MoxR-like ATPase
VNAPLDRAPDDDLALLQEAARAAQTMQRKVGAVVLGQQDSISALLAALFAQGHVLIIGVPGLAKTLMVKTVAQVLGWKFHRIQFTPDMMPSDITGMELLEFDEQRGQRQMRFVPGPIFANLVLGDEINRAPPKTQSALLEAMQERHVTSMGTSHPLEPPFSVVATQNPIEQEGTYKLPEAQLDRFMFGLWLDYPSEQNEEEIIMATTSPRDERIEPVVSMAQMRAYQELVHRLPVSRAMVNHAVALARATRPNGGGKRGDHFVDTYVQFGGGPRAAQHMVLAAKAMAVFDGEPTVSVSHIRRAAGLVMRHRIIMSYRAHAERIDSAQVVQHVLEAAPLPFTGRF